MTDSWHFIYETVCIGYMTLPGPSVPGRQFLDRHSNPNPNPIPNPVQELTVQDLTGQELTVQEVSCN